MKTNYLLAGVATALALSAIGASSAVAGSIPYPTVGTPNPVTYTFTAKATGDIIVYFAGSTASYDEQVGMLVDGTPSGVVGLDDHSSTLGQSLDLGPVVAGDTLTFFDDVSSISTTWYSDPSLNVDGGNHVYSTTAATGQVYSGSPSGTYVAFEDENFDSGSDYNYHDDTFIFENTVSSVPEPATWAMMLGGFGLLGAVLRGAIRTNRELEGLRSSAT